MSHLSTDTLWSLARKQASAAEAAEAHAHLADCAECRVSLEDVLMATNVLATLPEPPPMPQALARRVGESLAEALDAQSARAFTSWWQQLFTPRFLLVSAAALALVVAGAWWRAPSETTAPTPVPIAQPTPRPDPAPIPTTAAPTEAVVASARKASTEKTARLREGATVATQAGGQVWMKLPDGSRAGLTGGSEVKLASMQAHEVTLEVAKGSLAMVVPHREDRVLKVLAGEVEVKDLGTRFLVSRTTQRTLVAVEEGEVEVSTPGGRRDVKAGRAVSWANGKLTEFDWDPAPAAPVRAAPPQPRPQPQPDAGEPEAAAPESIARLGGEDDEALDVEDDEEDPEPEPEPAMSPPPLPRSPPTTVTKPKRGFSLQKLERKLRTLGARFTSPHAREAQVNNIGLSVEAGDCEYALVLAGKWLAAPTSRLKQEPELRRQVKRYQAHCLRAFGRDDEAAAIEDGL